MEGNMIKLSILIATMPKRNEKFLALYDCLFKQSNGKPVEIISDDSMEYNIGVKRNKLLEKANGGHIIYHDDDDFSSNSYVDLILKSIESNPDSVAINGIITINGGGERQWFISKEYKGWFEDNQIFYRTPNHISPIKRELALQAMFPEISFAEDAEFSRRVHPLLKTETKILPPIYHYDFYEHK